jgi:riboflavin transporter FmnP
VLELKVMNDGRTYCDFSNVEYVIGKLSSSIATGNTYSLYSNLLTFIVLGSAETKKGGLLDTLILILNFLLRYLFLTKPDISKKVIKDFFEGLKMYRGYSKEIKEGRGD